MATKAQIEANRINAQKSTGPRTDEGKARSRQNAIRHGICAGFPVMRDEDIQEARQTLELLREEFEPVGVSEEILVNKMAEHLHAARRAGVFLAGECGQWAQMSGYNAAGIALFLRYQGAADRAYYRAFCELRKVQKLRHLDEIGFVSQNTPDMPGKATEIAAQPAPAIPDLPVPTAPQPHPQAPPELFAEPPSPEPLKKAA